MIPEIIFITDSAKFDPIPTCRKLPKNSIVILRDYDLEPIKRLELAKTLKKICQRRKLLFLVGKTPELAIKVKANGMHLPEFMIGQLPKIRQNQPNWLVTAASHSHKSSYKAQKLGADAVLISPVYKTNSHPNTKPLGIHKAKKLQATHIFNYALGGCKLRHLNQLKSVNFQGIACISGLN